LLLPLVANAPPGNNQVPQERPRVLTGEQRHLHMGISQDTQRQDFNVVSYQCVAGVGRPVLVDLSGQQHWN
jgi:hypothetical protein